MRLDYQNTEKKPLETISTINSFKPLRGNSNVAERCQQVAAGEEGNSFACNRVLHRSKAPSGGKRGAHVFYYVE